MCGSGMCGSGMCGSGTCVGVMGNVWCVSKGHNMHASHTSS